MSLLAGTPSEKNPPSPTSARSNSSLAPASAPAPKLRSCTVCRTRKVRCDKLLPCSNCRRANIACVFPPTDRPPRWARRLKRMTSNGASNAPPAQDADPAAALVMERLRSLESLVKELKGQLKEANEAATSAVSGSPGIFSWEKSSHDHSKDHQRETSPHTNASNVQNQFGRLVLQDANRSRYVDSGFWSRVNDELDGLKMDSYGLGADDSDTSEDEVSSAKSPSSQELRRTPLERHTFLFRYSLNDSASDLREFHPLPSQIPFFLDVYSENVNSIIRILHIPTVAKMARNLRGSDATNLTPANEALMFSIYYAATTSMEDDDIMNNFGCTKTDLSLKYRLGLEHALAKADFLNIPDLVLVQAFSIFLLLARRHDSSRFVWMMTGLAIRMGLALGLHRDGAHFEHLNPYEIEMRRRVWWALCMLDVRASEDQGMDFTIARGSFDTKFPLNINDSDIEPGTSQTPSGHEGITDMSYSLVSFEICEVTRQMMAQGAKEGAPGVEEQSRLVNEIYQKLDQGYLQYSEGSDSIAYRVGVMVARLTMAKMTLFIYLPLLFSSPSEHFSDTIKTKLLTAAIETAEYNHALNAEQACRHWRWAFQTYTHWHAVVYLLIEICRRPWSPTVERAWVALHSQWLIPGQSHMDKNLRFWVPLRKLTGKARKHRDAELERLRSDPRAAERLEMDDRRTPVPASPGPFPAGSDVVEIFRERWRQLLALPKQSMQTPEQSGPGATSLSGHPTYTTQPSTSSIPASDAGVSGSNTTSESACFGPSELDPSWNLPSNTSPGFQPATGDFHLGHVPGPSSNPAPADPTAWSVGPGFVPWLWPTADPSNDVFATADVSALDINMDLDAVDWYNWVESAKGMEWDAGPGSSGQC